jgi:hypothetical protein
MNPIWNSRIAQYFERLDHLGYIGFDVTHMGSLVREGYINQVRGRFCGPLYQIQHEASYLAYLFD